MLKKNDQKEIGMYKSEMNIMKKKMYFIKNREKNQIRVIFR